MLVKGATDDITTTGQGKPKPVHVLRDIPYAFNHEQQQYALTSENTDM